MYHLRKLKEFRISDNILQVFYKSVIESVLFFSVSVWGGNITAQEKRMISRVRKNGGRITKAKCSALFDVYKSHALSLACKVIEDSSHPLAPAFTKLPSGRRFRQPKSRTSRYRNSFVPNVTAMMNL